MARKINSRQPHKPQKRVIGAGITEFWYLKHLKPLLGYNFELQPRLFGNESMGNINKLIEEGLDIGAEVVCFFDEDVKKGRTLKIKRGSSICLTRMIGTPIPNRDRIALTNLCLYLNMIICVKSNSNSGNPPF